MRHANQTSFKPGHVWTPEAKAKRIATLRRKYASGELKPPMLGFKPSHETIRKRSETRRRRCLGSRHVAKNSPGKSYWTVVTEEGRKYEHRVIMEKKLGRKLLRSEHVHHRNGDGLDNRPENLELLSASAHAKLHGPEAYRKAKPSILASIRLPPGKWARWFDHCQRCQTRNRPHCAHGYCHACFEKLRRDRRKAMQLSKP
jgi:hypothetical protein